MSGITELARCIRERDNIPQYTPMIGRIISLPDLKIRLGSRIILTADDIKSVFDLYQTVTHDNTKEYIHLDKEVVLLPCIGDNQFIAIGVVL